MPLWNVFQHFQAGYYLKAAVRHIKVFGKRRLQVEIRVQLTALFDLAFRYVNTQMLFYVLASAKEEIEPFAAETTNIKK